MADISVPINEQQAEAKAKRGRIKTMLALSVGYFIDQGEGQAMSVLFPTLQALWGLSYTQLGIIGTIRNLLQSITAPVWGYAADRFPRKNVIVFGTGIWGIWTLACGFSQNYQQLLVLRAISGIGLGCLMPATFSLIADTYPPHKRGRALGTLEGLGVLGIVVFTIGLGLLATPDLWRWGFFILGALSVISGLLVWFLVDEPVRGSAEPELKGKITEEAASSYGVKLSHIPGMLRIPTIWVAIAQGLAGAMPWIVLGLFMITWLVNERNMSEGTATIAFAAIVIGTAISNVLGGFLGDWADVRSPKYGRAAVGQVSIIIGIPLTYILFTQTADWPFSALVVLAFVTALFISWAGKGAKEPMVQAVTPPELRASAFAFIVLIENGFTALAALAAGSLADRIGLTAAMVWMIPVPWIVCAAIFTLFYWTYPRDSARMHAEMARRAQELDAES
ncbi:MAG: MFS transporter [Anaerolineae bacterium]|nr:MFS transporter [Anaerolineae bacterium]MCO5192904.1 MFS transporter [Anaerolineae bacterium]